MNKIHIGTLVKTVGLKGELRVYGLSDFLEDRFKVGNSVEFEDGSIHKINKSRFDKQMVTILFEDIQSIEQAQDYVDQKVYIAKEEIKALAENEFYFFDLVGCEVFNQGQYIGEVIEVFKQPSSEILRVKTEEKVVLIPLVKAFVNGVDVSNKRIDVNLIEGFL